MATKHPAVASAIKGLAAKLRMTTMLDAITNINTGIGTSRSKTVGSYYADTAPLDVATLETLFANNDLAYTIVSKPVDDALRAWFSVERTESTDDEAELAHDIQLEIERLGARELIKEGIVWGRLFGGGGVILSVEGTGNNLAMPMNDEDVTKIVKLIPFDRQDLVAQTWNGDGTVQTYIWTPVPIGGGTAIQPTQIHASRMLMFGGAMTTRRRKRMNMGWDLSILQRVYDVLVSFDAMWGSVDNMFADASQAVFKMQGLIQSLSESDGTGKDDVQTRLAFMDLVRSTAKAIMLDAGNKGQGEEAESFDVVERTTLGTLDGVIQTYMIRLATAARMPLTVLLGMAPAGMDATGESDLILYYNTVDIFRIDELEPSLLRFVKMLARTLGDSDVDSLRIKWPELARPKPLDVATAEKMYVDAAVELVTAQAMLPEEAMMNVSRFAPGMNLRVDLEARKKALEAGLSEVENREVGVGQLEAEGEVATTQAVKVAKAKPSPAQPARSSARKTPAKASGRQT